MAKLKFLSAVAIELFPFFVVSAIADSGSCCSICERLSRLLGIN